jgi:chemotaxis protein CheZ
MSVRQTSEIIAAKLEELKKENGANVSIEEVGVLAGSICDLVMVEVVAENTSLAAELKGMLDHISSARQEITAIQPRDMSANKIPDAADQLDAIIVATEEAANKILDAAEQVGEVAAEVKGEHADKLMEVSTNLFEASSFQDICGQRITKVTGTLRYLEEKLTALADAIGDHHVAAEKEVEFNQAGLVDDDDSLLNGPQLETEEGNSQDDIDALLASFD